MSDFKGIVSSPEILGGVPVIQDTEIPVSAILSCLADGCSVEEILSAFPALTEEKVGAAVAFALRSSVSGSEEIRKKAILNYLISSKDRRKMVAAAKVIVSSMFEGIEALLNEAEMGRRNLDESKS